MAKKSKKFGAGAFEKARRGNSSGVFIIDDVTSFYTLASINFPSETARAIRHVSYLIMHSTKRYMANDSHGKPLSELTKSRVLDKFHRGRTGTRRKKHAGDLNYQSRGLARAIHYDNRDGDPMSYLVGWASKDARRTTGPRFQGGSDRVMDSSMRKFLAKAAKELPERSKYRKILLSMAAKKDGHKFEAPAREVIDPVFAKWRSKIGPIFEKRVLKNLGELDKESYNAFLLDFTAPDKNAREAAEVAVGIRTRAGNQRRKRRAA